MQDNSSALIWTKTQIKYHWKAAVENIIWKVNWQRIRVKVNGEYLNDQRFVDNIVLKSQSSERITTKCKNPEKKMSECQIKNEERQKKDSLGRFRKTA